MFYPQNLLHIDNLSIVMMLMVSFVALCVASFSYRYFDGDRKRKAFFINLSATIVSVFTMVSADNLLLMLFAMLSSNIFLVRMMMHKKEWNAARNSSLLAFKNFSLGFLFLAAAFLLLYSLTGTLSIKEINESSVQSWWFVISAALIFLAAQSQSALWPFHRWLISSLNSPTPVSAIMHAGLVNGGGFLLVRFSPIFIQHTVLLNIIFVTGIITALLGTLWKLMQSDVKRMLACSTMGQMGFMIAQCGLGLFPAAVAHLCWHGLFKAYLFLASSSAAQEKRLDLEYPPSLKQFFVALLCGICGAYFFAIASDNTIFAKDTTLFLITLAMIAGTQLALPIIRGNSNFKFPLALISTLITGALYGFSVNLMESALAPTQILYTMPLNGLHVFALVALFVSWICILFARKPKRKESSALVIKTYVKMLNASQPHPKTITAHRNHYKF